MSQKNDVWGGGDRGNMQRKKQESGAHKQEIKQTTETNRVV